MWLQENAAELGVDPQRIVIGGESGGAGLAACLAQLAHDKDEVNVAAQVLLYPMLDDRTELTEFPEGVGEMIVRPVTVLFGWVAYLGYVPSPEVEPPPYPSASRREDLSGLPPAWIGVGALDPLCGESVEYAERLQAAGVETELVVIPGMYQGMDALKKPAETPVMVDFIESKLDALRRGLGMTWMSRTSFTPIAMRLLLMALMARV